MHTLFIILLIMHLIVSYTVPFVLCSVCFVVMGFVFVNEQ